MYIHVSPASPVWKESALCDGTAGSGYEKIILLGKRPHINHYQAAAAKTVTNTSKSWPRPSNFPRVLTWTTESTCLSKNCTLISNRDCSWELSIDWSNPGMAGFHFHTQKDLWALQQLRLQRWIQAQVCVLQQGDLTEVKFLEVSVGDQLKLAWINPYRGCNSEVQERNWLLVMATTFQGWQRNISNSTQYPR